MKDYTFQLEIDVRDYECDIQGIVNNANYMHYMEHTRHQFLRSTGISFLDLHNQGLDVVVARATMSYKSSLRGDETMLSCLNVRKEGIRYVFEQDIYRKSDGRLALTGVVEAVCTRDGRLCDDERLTAMFTPYFKK